MKKLVQKLQNTHFTSQTPLFSCNIRDMYLHLHFIKNPLKPSFLTDTINIGLSMQILNLAPPITPHSLLLIIRTYPQYCKTGTTPPYISLFFEFCPIILNTLTQIPWKLSTWLPIKRQSLEGKHTHSHNQHLVVL